MCWIYMNREKAATAFQKGKKLLKNKFSFLSKHDQNEVMLNLRNYSIRQLNSGKKEFWNEIFELYKLGLELNLIVDDKKISEAAFGNIVKAGCVVGQFKWVEGFIVNYEIFLDDKLRTDAKTLSIATFYFHKKDYEKTVSLLNQHQFNQILLQLDARILSIKARFYQFLENNDFYFFFISTLATDEKYFRRNKIIAEQKIVVHLNFILAIKQLSELIFNKTSSNIIKKKMEKFLNAEKKLASKDWLLDIIKEL